MLVDISPYLEKRHFPFEIFDQRLQDSFKELSEHYSIPMDYYGTTALFTIASLSGNMYTTELNGKIKQIIYAVLVGPSGLGKTPAYEQLCGDIIAPYAEDEYNAYKQRLKKWEEEQMAARIKKEEFTMPKPIHHQRIAKGGTMEGIMNNASKSRAGFGLYYDEGMKMMTSPNAYKKDGSSTDFWNEVWNGKPYVELRADDSRERMIPSTSISVILGMQTDRLPLVFTPDNIISGLSSRFLITSSDYITLNENVDHFTSKRNACQYWRDIVIALFNRGYDYNEKSAPYHIRFTEAAKKAYNDLSIKLTKESNINRMAVKIGDVSQLMIAYDSKLYQYVGRFISILAILENINNPVIEEHHVHNAEKLYRYYRVQAYSVFSTMNRVATTSLTDHERNLLDLLPDKFTLADAKNICEELKLSPTFFETAYNRKYKSMYVAKLKRGIYEKL